jgi:23S rRNA pseudouridine2605 synthase/23S rRNA pseudouridine2604 synthase
VGGIRLQKFLSEAGICSRRQGEAHILAGRVRVNAEVVTALGTRVDPLRDRVEFDGRPVSADRPLLYVALNKPRGYVTSCRQPGEPIVLDLVDLEERVYPVGRLDRDSTGLLLLTNDGRLHHRLSHPSFDHEKEYLVTVARPIPDAALEKMARGLPLMGSRTRTAEVERLSARRFRIVLKEGRNRQIRRMVRKVGHQVTRLKRTRVANVRLGDLPEGRWRRLTAKETRELLKDLE